MILRVKILLLWLLALAIPVQGFAAALQACAPAVAHSAAAGEHAMHQHGRHAGHDMHAAHAANDVPQHDHAQHKDASCSACAACTTGAMLPLALAAPPAPDLPSREFIAPPASGFVGFLPENPDRPPAFL